MNKYKISHLDGDNETFIIEAETAGKAKFENYRNWHDAFNGTFKEYLDRIIYCRTIKNEVTE